MSTSTSPSSTLPAFLRQSKSDIKAKYVDLEWAQRERLLQGTQQPATPSSTATHSPWARLTGDAITARNRYMNVEPYAANRVRLRVRDGENDYINASPIALGARRYIATQGPKDTSVAHFYRMLAQETRGRAVVVMLTQTHEAGREKCFQYFPLEEGESPMELAEEAGWGGSVVLEGFEEDEGARCQVRRLRLRARRKENVADGGAVAGAEHNGGMETEGSEAKVQNGDDEDEVDIQELEIHHLLFSGWPDFLIPEGDDRAALLNLVALSATLNTPSSSHPTSQSNGHPRPEDDQSNPRIVHCSAGVGRSGTFIALDYLLHLLQAGKLDDGVLEEGRDPIAETVDELRKQRMMMVQAESQFGFLYEVLKEAMERRVGGSGQGSEEAN